LEVDVDNVGEPRGGGGAGSALYAVPVKLSRAPSATWARIFPEVWNRPPEFTTMHRPGIARVSGDRVILDGTTIEEVRDYHARTLALVVAETNRHAAEAEQREADARQREADERAERERRVRDVGGDIRFE
jgi:hypothetical protein